MWGTDATSTVTLQDGPVTAFVGVDHWDWHPCGRRATRYEALEPIRQGVHRQFGTFSAGIATGLQVRHDHGSQYMSDDFQAELRFLGMTSSSAFVRAPEGNGVAERFIRTLKEQLLWVRTFQTVEDLRRALHDWLHLYNEQWLVERHGFRPPIHMRRDLLATPEAAWKPSMESTIEKKWRPARRNVVTHWP
jgi:transposase InsO family protein